MVAGLLPINDIEIMETFQSAQEFSRVKSWSVLIKSTLQLQMMEKLAAIDESQHQVELVRALKGKLERHDKGVSDLCQHCLFGHGMRNFWSGNDAGFAQDFHGVDTICVLFTHDIHLSSMPSAHTFNGILCSALFTLPKLPRPMTRKRSNASNVMGVLT